MCWPINMLFLVSFLLFVNWYFHLFIEYFLFRALIGRIRLLVGKGWLLCAVRGVVIVLVDHLYILLIHFHKRDFIILQFFDLLGHSSNSLLKLEIFHFQKVGLLAVFLLKTMRDLMTLLWGCVEVVFIEEGVVKKMGLW